MKKTFFGHPAGLFTLFFTEMWERFSYYGMRAILILFMVAKIGEENGGLELSPEKAGAIYGLYTASVYLLTLPGGWLADNIFGQRKSIWYGGIIIMLGHISLAIPGMATFYFGLALVAIGTGLLKANISTIVGDLYPEGGAPRDAGFSLYYMGINIGSFLGQLSVGFLGEIYDWHYGFGAAAVGMFVGLIVFKMTEKEYLGDVGIIPSAKLLKESKSDTQEMAGGNKLLKLIIIGVLLLGLISIIFYYQNFFNSSADQLLNISTVEWLALLMGYLIVFIAGIFFLYVLLFGNLNKLESRRVIVLIFLFIGISIFWSGFEQAGSSLNIFAKDYTGRYFGPLSISSMIPIIIGGIFLVLLSWLWYVKIYLREDLIPALKLILGIAFLGFSYVSYILLENVNGGWEMPASWLQAAGPMFVIIFAPIVGVLWIKLAAANANPSAPLKFAFGLLCMGMGFLMMMFAAQIAVAGLEDGSKASAGWLLLTYFLFTIGELTMSPIGLSMTTKLAPKKFYGQMMGIWFMGAALGNLIAGLFAGNFSPDNVNEMPNLFLTITMLGFGAGIFFLLLTPAIKKWIGDVQ